MRSIMQVPLKDAYTSRCVYVLTDGGISNTDSVSEVARSPQRAQSTISTIGIGSGASTELVTRLAQAGGGVHDMIQNEKIMAATVVKQMRISKSHR